jgi:CheY-like chemotaxis protein
MAVPPNLSPISSVLTSLRATVSGAELATTVPVVRRQPFGRNYRKSRPAIALVGAGRSKVRSARRFFPTYPEKRRSPSVEGDDGSAIAAAAAGVSIATKLARHIMGNELPALRVLIVDDEPLICWSLAETLSEDGDVVTEADSGEAAIRELANAPCPVDVVLLDYQLADSHHMRLLSTVKRLAPDSRVILMSAYCTPEMTTDALAMGAYRVVSKPIDMHDVPALVREAAGSRHH